MGGKFGGMSAIRIGTETAFGDGLFGSALDTPATSIDLRLEEEKIFPDEIRASYKQETAERGVLVVRGGFVTPITPDNLALLKTYPISRESDGMLSNSLALMVDRQHEENKYVGCYIDTVDLATSGADQRLLATIGIVGQNEATGSSITPSYGTDVAYHFAHGVFTIGGSEDKYVRSFAMTINNQSFVDLHGQDYELVEIPQGKRLITGTIVVTLNGTTYRAAWRAGSTLALELVFTHPSSGSPTKTLTIDIPEMELTGNPADVDPNAVITESLEFRAVDNDVAGYDIQISSTG